MPRVPDRWLNYSRYGRPVADKFVALRVPLARNYAIPVDQRFTPADAMSKLSLGLIIDLTNTTRYYDPREFTSMGVEHQKLLVKGHVVPEMNTVRRFISIVNGFLENENSKGKLIGVHCTHGLNRTGYLVCAYLILELGYTADDAIRLFNRQRGHNMERANYLESLQSFVPQSSNGDNRPSQQHSDQDNISIPRLQLVGKFRKNGVCPAWQQNERLPRQQGERMSMNVQSCHVPKGGRDTGYQGERISWRQGGRDTSHQGERHTSHQVERHDWRTGERDTRHQADRHNWRTGERDTRDQVDRHNWRTGERDTRYEWKRDTANRNHNRGRNMSQISSIGQWDQTTKRMVTHIRFPEGDE